MRLVRIENVRCQEWDSNTYVFAPADWSEDDIQYRVDKAVTNYIETVKTAHEKYKDGRPYPATFGPDYHKADPNKTVGEIREEFERRREENRKWEAETKKQRGWGFLQFLEEQGFFSLFSDEADEIVVEASANWGHMHGHTIDYNETHTEHVTPNQVAGVKEPYFG